MIVLTDHLQALVRDIVANVPDLAHIAPDSVLVFARAGRTNAAGPVASCHCVARSSGDPGYFFWEHVETKTMLRRTTYATRRSPLVRLGTTRVTHLISITCPRFCDQRLDRLPKRRLYGNAEPWVAKLDTLVHELYHIDPHGPGLREVVSGGRSTLHSPEFYAKVARLTLDYLDTRPSEALTACLRTDFHQLEEMHQGVAGRVFSNYPSYPREYWAPLDEQPDEPRVPVISLPRPPKTSFADSDLRLRVFRANGTSRAVPVMVEPRPSTLPLAA